MNVTHVNAFIESAVITFKTMMNDEIKLGKPELKTNNSAPSAISGVIGLSGEAQGALTLCFSREVGEKVVSAMLAGAKPITTQDLSDGIGELANIVAGQAKQRLNGLRVSLSLPNVVIGEDHYIGKQSSIPAVIIPFTSTFGAFTMEISLILLNGGSR